MKPAEEIVFTSSAILSGIAGMITGDLIWLTVVPAFLGASYSSWMRAQTSRLGVVDIVINIVMAATFGALVGPWVASMAPGKGATPLMIFVGALIGTRSIEKLHRLDWNLGDFITAIIHSLPTPTKKPPPDEKKGP